MSTPDPVKPWKEFSKKEMISLAEELYLDVNSNSYSIAHDIHKDLSENGIPPEDECSELLDTYLFTYGYITEDGGVAESFPKIAVIEKRPATNEESERATESETIIKEDIVVLNGTEYDKPECFSMAEQRDPACRRCKVYEVCMKERIRVRPPCFGTYERNHESCNVCLEALPCSQVVQGD